MKTLALVFGNYNSPVVNIDEACRRKKQLAGKWEIWTYYDIVRLRPMTASCRQEKASSFSYIGNKIGTDHGRGSKGLAHELVQHYFCQLGNNWTFRIFGKEIELKIKTIEDEYHIVDPETGQNRFVDIMIHLDSSCKYFNHFNGKIGIEVTDTSETSYTKTKTFKRLKLNVLELKMYEDWHLENKVEYKKEVVYSLRARIMGLLNKKPILNKLYIEKMI